mmetsp:Transcript_21651/g.54505  ORF Transcript_21651/g.54505 Transcript_21651/m.54505 type:complete len:203 (+) Transcript_21651:208-816(+)
MVRLAPEDRPAAVDLLHQHHVGHLVVQHHLGEPDHLGAALPHLLAVPKRPADAKHNAPKAVVPRVRDQLRHPLRRDVLAALVEHHDVVGGRQQLQHALALRSLLHLRVGRVLGVWPYLHLLEFCVVLNLCRVFIRHERRALAVLLGDREHAYRNRAHRSRQAGALSGGSDDRAPPSAGLTPGTCSHGCPGHGARRHRAPARP